MLSVLILLQKKISFLASQPPILTFKSTLIAFVIFLIITISLKEAPSSSKDCLTAVIPNFFIASNFLINFFINYYKFFFLTLSEISLTGITATIFINVKFLLIASLIFLFFDPL